MAHPKVQSKLLFSLLSVLLHILIFLLCDRSSIIDRLSSVLSWHTSKVQRNLNFSFFSDQFHAYFHDKKKQGNFDTALELELLFHRRFAQLMKVFSVFTNELVTKRGNQLTIVLWTIIVIMIENDHRGDWNLNWDVCCWRLRFRQIVRTTCFEWLF